LIASMLSDDDFDVVQQAESALHNVQMMRDSWSRGVRTTNLSPRSGVRPKGCAAELILRHMGTKDCPLRAQQSYSASPRRSIDALPPAA
jgi:hypothetical protein